MTIDRPIVFVHIPKAAGSTLTSVLEAQFEPEARFHSAHQGTTQWEACLAYARKPEAERAKSRFLWGHLEMAAVAAVPGDPFIFTFMREPLSRLVSLHRYIARTPSHHMHGLVKGGADLAGLVRSHPWDELRNGMTRRLSGVLGKRMPVYDEGLLKRALRTLELRFSFVGLQESFDKSLFLLGRRLGLTPSDLVYRSRNRAPKKDQADRVDEETRRIVREHNRMDAVIYDHARERFHKEARVLRGALGKEYERFRKRLKAQRQEATRAA